MAPLSALRAPKAQRKLPQVPRVTVPLFREDVQGLRSLRVLAEALFDPANQRAAIPAKEN